MALLSSLPRLATILLPTEHWIMSLPAKAVAVLPEYARRVFVFSLILNTKLGVSRLCFSEISLLLVQNANKDIGSA